MTKHTATPWRADGIAIYAAGHPSQVAQGFDPTQRTADDRMNIAIARGNAAFIARAVNSHESLIQALAGLRLQLRKRECSVADCKALDEADSALKAAGAP